MDRRSDIERGALARTVAVTTLGCRSNQYDSSAIEDMLAAAGCEVVRFPSRADAYVINTCTVTGNTDQQSRQLIRKAKRLNPDSVIIVTGCYAQVSPESVARIEGVDYVLGNPEKSRVAELIVAGRPGVAGGAGGGGGGGGRVTTLVGPVSKTNPAPAPINLFARSASGRTRANLKIQDGCNSACTYCIIPKARGRSRSLTVEEVVREADSLSALGYQEIVLTGIHLGAWGADLTPERTLIDLIKNIESKNYPCRFRLSSIEPDSITDELIETLASAQSICNHIHLPIQSGDDTVLRSMNRPYTRAELEEKIARLVGRVPGIAVGVDVMAGFPGEGEAEFENTFALLSDLPLAYMHVFPFSVRTGTRAETMKDRVEGATIKKRCKRLNALDITKRAEFFKRQVGTYATVLVESRRGGAGGAGGAGAGGQSNSPSRGRTGNYILVEIPDATARAGLIEVVLTGMIEGGMSAEPRHVLAPSVTDVPRVEAR